MKAFHNKKAVEETLKQIRFDPWNLMGNYNKEKRRELLLNITGEKRPFAKCGVNAIQEELETRIDTTAKTCQAVVPEIFRKHFVA